MASYYETDGTAGSNSYYGYHGSKYYADYFYIPSSLTKVTITGSSTIAYGAFHNCTSIKEIIIADTVTKIGDRAFQNCNKIDTLKLSNSLTEIGGYAFYYCDGLTDVEIPAGVSIIGDYSFYDCTTPTDVGLSSRALCVLSYRFRSKTLAPRAFFVHCFRVFRVCLW